VNCISNILQTPDIKTHPCPSLKIYLSIHWVLSRLLRRIVGVYHNYKIHHFLAGLVSLYTVSSLGFESLDSKFGIFKIGVIEYTVQRILKFNRKQSRAEKRGPQQILMNKFLSNTSN
jgi:hypothetical protein